MKLDERRLFCHLQDLAETARCSPLTFEEKKKLKLWVYQNILLYPIFISMYIKTKLTSKSYLISKQLLPNIYNDIEEDIYNKYINYKKIFLKSLCQVEGYRNADGLILEKGMNTARDPVIVLRDYVLSHYMFGLDGTILRLKDGEMLQHKKTQDGCPLNPMEVVINWDNMHLIDWPKKLEKQHGHLFDSETKFWFHINEFRKNMPKQYLEMGWKPKPVNVTVKDEIAAKFEFLYQIGVPIDSRIENHLKYSNYKKSEDWENYFLMRIWKNKKNKKINIQKYIQKVDKFKPFIGDIPGTRKRRYIKPKFSIFR
eukprot:GHVL01002107.1.p1 GENE.GHVL01002107.1~~GHVL01002107.1.p1  ORF type:complete len:312 (+),score=81.71 GHVL01002107.1:788-1723(+)